MKYININWNNWIQPNNIKNYIINDPLLDWLNMYGNYKKDHYKTENNFNEYIYNTSIKFKEAVYKNLFKRFKADTIKVCDNNEINSIDKFLETKSLMKEGIPIIINGLLHDYRRKMFSIPDLIIRSDYIKYVYDSNDSGDLNKECNYSKEWHYRIINLKYCSMYLHKNNITIKNKSNIKYTKAKCIFENKILGTIQNYTPSISYIHSYKINFNKQTYNGFCKLGEILIDKTDKLIDEKIYSAINWIKQLNKNGKKWKIGDITELYPNMCNKCDYPYHNAKKIIAKELNEITLIWNISYLERNMYHNKGIYSFKNIKSHNNPIINKMINCKLINNNIKNQVIKNINISNNIKKFYVDFETTYISNNNFNDIINYNTYKRIVSKIK